MDKTFIIGSNVGCEIFVNDTDIGVAPVKVTLEVGASYIFKAVYGDVTKTAERVITEDSKDMKFTFDSVDGKLDKLFEVISEFCNDTAEVHAVALACCHVFELRLKPATYDEIMVLDISPEWKTDVQNEYHYYRTLFWIIRGGLFALLIVYLLIYSPELLLDIITKVIDGGII